MAGLEDYASNTASQNGEDGIIAEIFNRIEPKSKLCVEFGAWDGKHLSNTWALWHEIGWSAILIEGDRDRYIELCEAINSFPSVKGIHAYVASEGANTLDNLLGRAGVGADDIDLLSIDIDGDDYHAWEAMTFYRPRVVVIEYNPTIPPEIDLVQRRGEYFGASAAALTRLAKSKGYELATCTRTNCIFVLSQDFALLNIPGYNLKQGFDRGHLCYLINAYDGRTFLTSSPVYSRPLPIATFAYWSERLKQNLFDEPTDLILPAPGLQPVSLVLESMDTHRRLSMRLQALLARSVGDAATSLPPYRMSKRLLHRIQRKWHERAEIQTWRRSGSPVPPPHVYKQKVVSRYASRYRLSTLVETGTYLGDMIFSLRKNFQAIISIELSHELCERAQQRLSSFSNISIIQGDSADVLPNVLANIKTPTLFWLDGHYSAGNTALGKHETPVSAEVEAILNHPVKGHVILIDDARNFNGSHDYPTLCALKDYVLGAIPKADFSVKDDIIRIVL